MSKEVFKCAHTAIVEIHKLVPHPQNCNNHPDKQIEMLAKIIDFQGQRVPIVVSKRSGFITKGHGRLMALLKLGWDKAAVDFQDYENEAQEFADLIADNKIAELAQHDDQKMYEFINQLDLTSLPTLDLLGVGNFINTEKIDINNSSAELDISSFDNFDNQCPKCGFEWNNDTTT